MKNNVKPIPEGYHTVTPYLTISGAAAAIDFYKRAFDAKEIMRFPMGDRIGHAEIQIGDSRIMLADPFTEAGHKDPKMLGGSPVGLSIYVEDVDSFFKRAIDAGARVDNNMEVKDQFYGDRSGSLVDPFGHKWTIATHKEDVPMDEMRKRAETMMSQNAHAEGKEA